MTRFDDAHALVVGIARYQAVNPLPATVLNDAQDIYDLLIDPAHCGYETANVQLLLDGEATGSALRSALAELAQRSDAESTVSIYFSGHGGRIQAGPHAGEYLLPIDVAYHSPQALAASAISGDEFTEAIGKIPARKLLVFFDCCHAAGIGQPKDATMPSLKAGLSEGYYEALKAGRGRVILASSRDTEYSYVLKKDARNSLFTQHLLAGLRGGISSSDGLIRIFDLFEYVQPRVTGDKPNQHPVFKAELEENFPVALRLGGQAKAIQTGDDGYVHDVYVSYVPQESDMGWVWQTLMPRLKEAGLRIAVSGFSEEPGVALVVGIQRAIEQSRRTLMVLTQAYVADAWADFHTTLAQTLSIEERQARLLPVVIDPALIDQHGHIAEPAELRTRILQPLDLTNKYFGQANLDRLPGLLQAPLSPR